MFTFTCQKCGKIFEAFVHYRKYCDICRLPARKPSVYPHRDESLLSRYNSSGYLKQEFRDES